MSRHLSTRNDRFAQMSKQEAIIAKKRQEILEKKKTSELAKAVAAAQSQTAKLNAESDNKTACEGKDLTTEKQMTLTLQYLPKPQNSFCNDGSFLAHFKKILEKHETPTTTHIHHVESKNIESCNVETTSDHVREISSIEPSEQVAFQQNLSLNCKLLPSFQDNIHISTKQHQHGDMSTFTQQSQLFNPSIPPPILNAHGHVPPPPPPPPPPRPLPLSLSNPSLYMIPPPEPLQLNTIPPPKEIDLNTIPKPRLNLDAIEVPTADKKVFSEINDHITIPTSIESLIKLVADYGDEYEDKIRSLKIDIPSALWFLFERVSDNYRAYRKQVEVRRVQQKQKQLPSSSNSQTSVDEKYDPESAIGDDSDDEYMRGMMDRNRDNLKRRIECRNELSEEEREIARQKRVRKTRWGDKIECLDDEDLSASSASFIASAFDNQNKPHLLTIQRNDPQLLQYARLNYGTTTLSEEDWKKCEEHFKVNLLYQDMMKKRQEIDRLARSGKFKYEYDSDEDVSGGTWEHKLRTAEMVATQAWASALTKQSEGKHHIGDFLPPEELKKFMEQYEAKKWNRQPDLSDYKEYKLCEDNIGFQMLQKLGWKEGQGLGFAGSGIVDPVNKAPQREGNQGLGVTSAATPEDCDNEYEAYRKRMMLAYRFRPNPLNNPRRAYY